MKPRRLRSSLILFSILALLVTAGTLVRERAAATGFRGVFRQANGFPPATAAPDCVPPPSQMVGWWPGDFNAKDIQGGNAATLQNGALFTTGKVSQAFHLDGVGDSISITDNTGALNVTGNQVSIDAWIKLQNNQTTAQKFTGVIGKNVFSSGQPYQIVFESGPIAGNSFNTLPQNKWQFEYILTNAAGTRLHDQTTAIVITVDAVYHHFTMTYDGANVRLYVDAVLRYTRPFTGNLRANPTVPVVIGGGAPFAVDEVEIFNRALTQTEIQSIVNADSSGKCKAQPAPTPTPTATPTPTPTPTPGPAPSVVQLVLDQSGSQVAAIDSVLFLREPFSTLNAWNSLMGAPDRSTRVMVFATNLQLAQGETPAAVVLNLVDSNNRSYDLAAEDVRPVPNSPFTQAVFKLPDDLSAGACTLKVRAHGQVSNSGIVTVNTTPAIVEASATIGPAGGVVEVTNPFSPLFRTKVDVPPNALNANTLISIRRLTNSPGIGKLAGPNIDFQPDGLVFKTPARITLPYADTDNDGKVDAANVKEEFLETYFFDAGNAEWVLSPKRISQDTFLNTVTLDVNHFTPYSDIFFCLLDLETCFNPGAIPQTNVSFLVENDSAHLSDAEDILARTAINAAFESWNQKLAANGIGIRFVPTTDPANGDVLLRWSGDATPFSAFDDSVPGVAPSVAATTPFRRLIRFNDRNSFWDPAVAGQAGFSVSGSFPTNCGKGPGKKAVYDLQGILTHEIGHVLGLPDNFRPNSTMRAQIDPCSASLSLRNVDDLDIASVVSRYNVTPTPTPTPTPSPTPSQSAETYTGTVTSVDIHTYPNSPGWIPDPYTITTTAAYTATLSVNSSLMLPLPFSGTVTDAAHNEISSFPAESYPALGITVPASSSTTFIPTFVSSFTGTGSSTSPTFVLPDPPNETHTITSTIKMDPVTGIVTLQIHYRGTTVFGAGDSFTTTIDYNLIRQ